MPDAIALISEPLLGMEFTQCRVVGPLAEKLSDRFEMSVIAPAISEDVAAHLRSRGVEPVSGGALFPPRRGPRDEVPSFVYSWCRDALIPKNARRTEQLLNGRSALRVNMSMTNSVGSDLWYLQSRPIGNSIDSVIPNLGLGMRAASHLAAPVVRLLDRHHFAATIGRTKRLYTNSGHLLRWYRHQGYRVAGALPTFLFPQTFAPTTRAPSRDYVLVYLGKETDMAALADLIATGIPLRMFGAKSAQWVRQQLGHHLPANVTMCGYVTHEQLMDLYSNALFTAFPFTEEPFGLVPVESMACGTPVLTYSAQGPGETVVNGFTGWLVPNPDEFVEAAQRIFRRGYPSVMPSAAVDHAQWFQLGSVASIWTAVFRSCLDGREDPLARLESFPVPARATIASRAEAAASMSSWVLPPAGNFFQR